MNLIELSISILDITYTIVHIFIQGCIKKKSLIFRIINDNLRN